MSPKSSNTYIIRLNPTFFKHFSLIFTIPPHCNISRGNLIFIFEVTHILCAKGIVQPQNLQKKRQTHISELALWNYSPSRCIVSLSETTIKRYQPF